MDWIARLSQINLVVADMDASLAFYARLGWTIERPVLEHAVARFDAITVEFDTTGFAQMWDSSYAGATGGSTVVGVEVETREAVDALYADLTAAGHRGRQPPYDAFWGSRYAIVEDPDANAVGLMSPSDDRHRAWPPTPAPRA